PAFPPAPRHRRRADPKGGLSMATHAALPRNPRPFRWSSPVTYMLATAVAAVAIGPVVYVILGGFRTTGQIAVNPAALPHPWVWETYRHVLDNSRFWRQVFNSTLIALGTTAGVVTLGAMAAAVLA